MKFFYLFLLLSAFSCNKNVLTFDKADYSNLDNERYIHARYNQTKELFEKSDCQFTVINSKNTEMYVFSTVLENQSMFYSKRNYSKNHQYLKLNSFYKGYMKDAVHSGIRKFNFIQIKPGDSLKINLDNQILNDVNKAELNYSYFFSNQKEELINIDRIQILKGTEIMDCN